MKPTSISVVVPTFNSADVLPQTLRSILEQKNVPGLEVLVIDDGSTDGTAEVVGALEDPRLRYVRREHTGGPAAPRNTGVRMASGMLIGLCDADDPLQPGVLAAAVQALDADPRVALTFTDFARMDEQGCNVGPRLLGAFTGFVRLSRESIGPGMFRIPSPEAYGCLLEENFIRTSGLVVRAEILSQVGPFDESLENGDDKDMWLRITRLHDVAYLDRVGFHYRDRSGSISRRGGRLARSRIRVLEKQLEPGDLAPELVTRVRRQIARNLVALAFDRQQAGATREARSYYGKSLAHHVQWPAIRGWLTCLAGPLYSTLKGKR